MFLKGIWPNKKNRLRLFDRTSIDESLSDDAIDFGKTAKKNLTSLYLDDSDERRSTLRVISNILWFQMLHS